MQVLLKNDPEQVVESAQCGPFVVVWKSMDEVHYPGKERRTFHFRREPVKGSMIIDEIIRAQLAPRFAPKYERKTPRDLMLTLNDSIYAFQMSEHLPMDQADELCGARMIVAKEESMFIDIAFTGDCFAVAEHEPGRVEMSVNQTYSYNYRMYTMIEEFWREAARRLELNPDNVEQGTEEWNNLRLEMWRLFGPQLVNERRLHVNNYKSQEGHGVLNGQDGVRNFTAQTFFPTKGLRYVLLGNNGCTPWDMEKDVPRKDLGHQLARTVNHANDPSASLDAVIAQARKIEQATKISHAKGGRADAACAIIKP